MARFSTTIAVAISAESMGVSHTGIGVSEYSISMHTNTIGTSMHRELYSETPWGVPQHGGFHASYTGCLSMTLTFTSGEQILNA